MANADIGLHRMPGLADADHYGNIDLVAPGQKIRREEVPQRVTLIPTPDKSGGAPVRKIQRAFRAKVGHIHRTAAADRTVDRAPSIGRR